MWWTGDQLALLYSVFIYSLFTSFLVTPYESFFGLFIVSSIFASVFNHRPCPKVHSSPVHDFMMHSFIVRKASPEGYLFQASGVTKGRKITS